VIDSNDITNKQMRALTCAVIKSALIEIKNTYCYRNLKHIQDWVRGETYWWDCLDIFCGIDVERAKKNLTGRIIAQKIKIKEHDRKQRIAKIKNRRTAPLLVFRSDRSASFLRRKSRNRNIANVNAGRVRIMGFNRPDLHIVRNVQRQPGAVDYKMEQLKLL
jgi:hypothetical protein